MLAAMYSGWDIYNDRAPGIALEEKTFIEFSATGKLHDG